MALLWQRLAFYLPAAATTTATNNNNNANNVQTALNKRRQRRPAMRGKNNATKGNIVEHVWCVCVCAWQCVRVQVVVCMWVHAKLWACVWITSMWIETQRHTHLMLQQAKHWAPFYSCNNSEKREFQEANSPKIKINFLNCVAISLGSIKDQTLIALFLRREFFIKF